MVRRTIVGRKKDTVCKFKNAMKQSCDTYFYEIARRLGVDKLSETAKKFGLGKKFLKIYFIMKKRFSTKYRMEKNALGRGWLWEKQ